MVGVSRAKLLHELEKYFFNINREYDGGLAILKDISNTLDMKSGVVRKETWNCDILLISLSLEKDFKINDCIGEYASCFGYMSIMRQVESGVQKGYTNREIVDGVIKAIQTDSKLRGYLEGREELRDLHDLVDLHVFQSIIRAFYKEKSSTELYQELCHLRQELKETTLDFVFKALGLKQKIIFASKEPDKLSYEKKLAEKQFQHNVSTGIGDDAIKTEIHSLL